MVALGRSFDESAVGCESSFQRTPCNRGAGQEPVQFSVCGIERPSRYQVRNRGRSEPRKQGRIRATAACRAPRTAPSRQPQRWRGSVERTFRSARPVWFGAVSPESLEERSASVLTEFTEVDQLDESAAFLGKGGQRAVPGEDGRIHAGGVRPSLKKPGKPELLKCSQQLINLHPEQSQKVSTTDEALLLHRDT